ncbi:MAG: SDR family oxidoreductase [Xanthomonadales bacterium]|nr:SDR family oxidoreductase [Xanthomonadales bacterium]
MTDYTNTIAITGAGSGFGAAIARHYAACGWRVAISDIDLARAENTLKSLAREFPGFKGFAFRLDVTSNEEWSGFSDRIAEEWGGLTVLVNNAGVATGGNLEDTPLEDWDWVINIDLMGVVRGCKQFISLFKHQGDGHIVNISSFAGIAGAPDIVSYGVAKAGVIALSEALRAELTAFGVGVTVVCPAFVKTDLLSTFRSPEAADKARVTRWMENSKVTVEDVARQISVAVETNKFLLLTHKNTRRYWWLKRWLPETYFKIMQKAIVKKEQRLAAKEDEK